MDNEIDLERIFEDEGPVVVRPPMSKNNICLCGDNQVCLKHNLNSLKLCKNYDKFIKTHPFVQSIFEETKLNFDKEPNFKKSNNELIIKRNVNILLENIEFHYSYKHKAIFITALYDYIYRNAWITRKKRYISYVINRVFETIVNPNVDKHLKSLDVDVQMLNEKLSLVENRSLEKNKKEKKVLISMFKNIDVKA